MATKVCVVLESSSQGANGVKENEASFEFVRLIQCLETVLVNHAGCLGPAGCRGERCSLPVASSEGPWT